MLKIFVNQAPYKPKQAKGSHGLGAWGFRMYCVLGRINPCDAEGKGQSRLLLATVGYQPDIANYDVSMANVCY